MTFKNVTVIESVDPNKSISSYKSFECDYDSAEFDDVTIDEGERCEMTEDRYHNNDIKKLNIRKIKSCNIRVPNSLDEVEVEMWGKTRFEGHFFRI